MPGDDAVACRSATRLSRSVMVSWQSLNISVQGSEKMSNGHSLLSTYCHQGATSSGQPRTNGRQLSGRRRRKPVEPRLDIVPG